MYVVDVVFKNYYIIFGNFYWFSCLVLVYLGGWSYGCFDSGSIE